MNDFRSNWLTGLQTICLLVSCIWVVEVVNNLQGHRLNSLGIYPREIETLPGIVLWPLLHGNLQHLVMNTTPLLFMGFFVALRGPSLFIKSTLLIVVLSGSGVWVFGRSAYHIGASGLVFGYFGFLVAIGVYEKSISGLAIASITLFYYGGIVVGVLPTSGFVSWEGHFFGLCAGVLAARLLAIRQQSL